MELRHDNAILLSMKVERLGRLKANDWIMLCLGMVIVFENIDLIQIKYLASEKISNLNLS